MVIESSRHASARLTLPLVQIVIAATLFIVGRYTRTVVPGREYYYGEAATRVCHALNAPVMLFRFVVLGLWNAAHLTGSSVENVVDTGIFLVGVGLLWYLVGATIDSWRQEHVVILVTLPAWARVSLGLFLIIVGILLGIMGIGIWNLIRWKSVLQATLEASLYELWALGLIGFCACDLLRLVRIKGEAPSNSRT